MPVHVIECNPFQENTFIIEDAQSGSAMLVDCGCYDGREQNRLIETLKEHHLKVERYLLTHAHIDHIFGNKWVFDTWGLLPELHEREIGVLNAGMSVAAQYGLRYEPGPGYNKTFLSGGDVISIGSTELIVLETPGHSPGGICFWNQAESWVIAGDALFRGGIGRTDLPGGNHAQLLLSIRSELFTLPEETIVYPGHGPATSVGYEKNHNPFF